MRVNRFLGTPFWMGALLAAALCAPVAQAAESEADKLAALQQKLDRSVQMIDALAARVQQLEAKLKEPQTPSATAQASAADAERIQSVEQKVAQIETANATRRSDDYGLPVHGFADVGAGTYNPTSTAVKGFNVGNLDLYLTPRLGDRTRALFELNFEVGQDGSVGVDLERAQLGYQFADSATVWLGRFHTPYGYVNTALHHGSWLSNSLRRPKFLQFEDHGGILPAHTVGAWVTGSVRTDGGRVTYDAYLGNSQLIQGGIVDMRNAGNAHGSLITGGRLGYQFSSGVLDGFAAGVHAFSTRVEDDLTPLHATRVNSYGSYLVYDTDQWENMAELYWFNDKDLSGATGSHHSTAGFVQVGYRLTRTVPYLRYERTSLDQSDEYFQQQISGGSYHRTALGLRYDLDSKAALKFELATTRDTDRLRDQYNEALVQYAIRY